MKPSFMWVQPHMLMARSFLAHPGEKLRPTPVKSLTPPRCNACRLGQFSSTSTTVTEVSLMHPETSRDCSPGDALMRDSRPPSVSIVSLPRFKIRSFGAPVAILATPISVTCEHPHRSSRLKAGHPLAKMPNSASVMDPHIIPVSTLPSALSDSIASSIIDSISGLNEIPLSCFRLPLGLGLGLGLGGL